MFVTLVLVTELQFKTHYFPYTNCSWTHPDHIPLQHFQFL